MEYKNKRGVNIGLYYLKQKGYSEVLKEKQKKCRRSVHLLKEKDKTSLKT